MTGGSITSSQEWSHTPVPFTGHIVQCHWLLLPDSSLCVLLLPSREQHTVSLRCLDGMESSELAAQCTPEILHPLQKGD